MNMPKLKPIQWFKLVLQVYPTVKELAKITEEGFLTTLRAILDLMGKAEDMYPEEGSGENKFLFFWELFQAGFYTASEIKPDLQRLKALVLETVTSIKTLLKSFGFFARIKQTG